jgi:hypothetical protein
MNSRLEPIRRSILVRCSVEKAFRVFTQEMSAWWPLDTHSRVVDEGRAGVSASVCRPSRDHATTGCPGNSNRSGSTRAGYRRR